MEPPTTEPVGAESRTEKVSETRRELWADVLVKISVVESLRAIAGDLIGTIKKPTGTEPTRLLPNAPTTVVRGKSRGQKPTSAAGPDACATGFVVCGGTGGAGTCFRYVTTESESRCLRINQRTNPFCAGTPCNSSADCGPRQRCADLHGPTCCTAKICGPDCAEFGNTV